MDWLTNTVRFDIEVTSYCNAACPGCERNIEGGKLNPRLDLKHMDMDVWLQFLDSIKGRDVRRVEMNGNVGDFSMHPDIIDMLDKLVTQHPNVIIGAQTNGGARNEKFWTELGKVLKNNYSEIGFAVDGISNEMNHVHRRNVSFDLAMRNAKAFISGGSNAYWVYTMFDHTLEGMAQAEKIATEVGFRRITFRHSCIDQEDMIVNTPKEKYMVGTEKIWDHKERVVKNDDVGWDFEHPKEMADEYTPIESFGNQCLAYHMRKINIDYRGNVFPCSYLYSDNVFVDGNAIKFRLNGKIIKWKIIPSEELNLKHKTLDEILNGKFFKSLQNIIPSCQLYACEKWCITRRVKPINTIIDVSSGE